MCGRQQILTTRMLIAITSKAITSRITKLTKLIILVSIAVAQEQPTTMRRTLMITINPCLVLVLRLFLYALCGFCKNSCFDGTKRDRTRFVHSPSRYRTENDLTLARPRSNCHELAVAVFAKAECATTLLYSISGPEHLEREM